MKYLSLLVTTAVLSVFMMLSVHACTFGSETHMTDAGTVKVDRDGEMADITFEAEDGGIFRMSIHRGELPEEWPPEIRVIPGGNIIFSQTETKTNMRQISIETEQPVNDTIDFYEDLLRSGRWGIENSVTIGSMNMLTAKKGDSEIMLQAVEAPGKSGTHVQIIIK